VAQTRFIHLATEFRRLDGTPGRPTSALGVVAAARHFQLSAHEVDPKAGLLRLDQGELHWLSFAKKAAAFFSSATK
jgi:hypothetical protein